VDSSNEGYLPAQEDLPALAAGTIAALSLCLLKSTNEYVRTILRFLQYNIFL
jgi:hypothetical protein